MEKAQRPAFPKPTEARTRLQPRERVSVDVWLAGKGGRDG